MNDQKKTDVEFIHTLLFELYGYLQEKELNTEQLSQPVMEDTWQVSKGRNVFFWSN